MEHQIKELNAINALTRAVTASLLLDQVVSAAYDQILSIIEPDLMVIYLRKGDNLICQGEKPQNQKWRNEAPEVKTVGKCLCGLVAVEKTPIYAIDIHADPRCILNECKKAGICSFTALPLMADNEVLGVLGLGSFQSRDFSQQSTFLEITASQISTGSNNAILHGKIQQEKIKLEKSLVTRNKALAERKKAEALLHEHVIMLENILEKAADGICVCHNIPEKPYVRFTHWNPRMTQITGYTMEEINQLGWYQSLYPDPKLQKKAVDRMARMRKGDDIHSEEWIITTKNGDKKPLSISTSIIEEKDGNVYVLGVMQDISNRKKAEETLRKSEEKYRLHFNQVNDVIYSIDTEFKVLTVSPSVEKLLGYKPAQLIGRPFPELNILTPEYLEQAFLDTVKVFSGENISSSIYEFIAKDGTKKFGEVSGAPLTRDNKVVAVISVARDITERKASEEALKRSQEQYSGVVENANDAIIILQDGMIVFHNARTETLTGYSKEELAETPFSHFVIPDDRDTLLEQYQKRLNGEKFDTSYAFGIINKKGNEIWAEVNTVVVSWKGKPALQCFIRDVTLQKRLKDQLHQSHKLEAIGTLAGGIAHDFNNIISIILGNTELAMYDVPEWSPARKNLETVRNACFRARDVVRQILSFSRQTEQERKPIILGSIIKESLKLLRSSIPTTIDIRQHIPATTDTILADPAQIHQVIINLCTNSAHAMKEKGGVIEVSLEETTLDQNSAQQYPGLSPGRYMRLTVSDTGQGIDPKIMDRIFDPYFTTKKIGEGSGMGLAIVHGIVKTHGGAITVYSEPGKGSSLRILFPKVETKPEFQKETPEELPRGKEKILYVDDEISLAEIGQQMLEYLGYQVESKTNPIEVLEMFKANPHEFDLVITDMTMPQMTGKMLAQELIRIRPDIPIILNSGYSDQMDEKKAKELGIRAYIMKPLNTMNLAKIIRSVLDKR